MLRLNQESKVTGIAIPETATNTQARVFSVHLEEGGEDDEKYINHQGRWGAMDHRKPSWPECLQNLWAGPLIWTGPLLGHVGWCQDQCGPALSKDSHIKITSLGPNPFCWSSQSSERTPSGEAPRTRERVTRKGYTILQLGRISMMRISANHRDDPC